MNDLRKTDIRYLKGVGENRQQLFSKLGVDSVGALLHLYPRRYLDYTLFSVMSAPDNRPVAVRATVWKKNVPVRLTGGRTMFKLAAGDESGDFIVTFFNTRYIFDALKVGKEYIFYGKFSKNLIEREVASPAIISENDLSSLSPVYPQTAGLSSKIIGSAVKRALEMYDNAPPLDILPGKIIDKFGLCTESEALHSIHFPTDIDAAARARERLAFDELLTLNIGMKLMRGQSKKKTDVKIEKNDPQSFIDSLPFSLTADQLAAVTDICTDFSHDTTMNRLLQGDVGSGKTVVAAAGVYCAAMSGYQSAIMAPTEMLAVQHAETFTRLLKPFGIAVELLTGSTGQKERRRITLDVELGRTSVLIGTHALLSDKLNFKKLGFVVADEQHRFGVRQRSTLTQKGDAPHLLVMSATPIPRTLALIIYGDLDISAIKTMPSGRTPIKTYLVNESYRSRYLGFVRDAVGRGEQAYIVCPMIEENEMMSDVASAAEYYDEIKEKYLGGISVGLVHGKMKPAEKNLIMEQFKSGALSVLVSTTVIEVGVDVPNATVMIVENAERFGLSALHQIRGRVGRGTGKSYCILVSSSDNERLKTLCKTNDGFEIAQKDLELRGPGDFLGSRQHGLPELNAASIDGGGYSVDRVREAAQEILDGDPTLERAEHSALKNKITEMFESLKGSLN